MKSANHRGEVSYFLLPGDTETVKRTLKQLEASRNALRHGLLAATVVLEEESSERFLALLSRYINEFKPATPAQVSLVETMAVARWRQLRVWGAQKTALDRDIALQDPSIGPPSVRALLALSGGSSAPGASTPSELLLRYELAFDRQFSRALTRLLSLQSLNPSPAEPYFPGSPSGQTWKHEISATKGTQQPDENE